MNPWSVNILCKYFLPFCGLSFHFVYDFLCCTKTLKINLVLFIYFSLYFHYPRRWIEKDIAAILCQRVFCLCFPSFIVSSLIFRSLIHFEWGFFFLYDVKECFNFIILQVTVQFSQHHYWRECSLHCMVLPPLS